MTQIKRAADIGTDIRKARKSLGLTQSQLALAAGVGVRFIVDLEAGKASVRLEKVLQVLAALGGTLTLGGMSPEAGDKK